MAFLNLTEKRFGRLIALYPSHTSGGRGAWVCRCECGNVTTALTYSLTSGKTKSCGCIRREVAAKKATKHGEANAPLYHVPNSMHQRCENPRAHDYQWYGAMGVTVCDEWKLTEYPAFKAWALENGYRPGLTIDRIDPGKGYSPDNCRWITIAEQQRNRRKKD